VGKRTQKDKKRKKTNGKNPGSKRLDVQKERIIPLLDGRKKALFKRGPYQSRLDKVKTKIMALREFGGNRCWLASPLTEEKQTALVEY